VTHSIPRIARYAKQASRSHWGLVFLFAGRRMRPEFIVALAIRPRPSHSPGHAGLPGPRSRSGTSDRYSADTSAWPARSPSRPPLGREGTARSPQTLVARSHDGQPPFVQPRSLRIWLGWVLAESSSTILPSWSLVRPRHQGSDHGFNTCHVDRVAPLGTWDDANIRASAYPTYSSAFRDGESRSIKKGNHRQSGSL
jgi:hypothetical protein